MQKLLGSAPLLGQCVPGEERGLAGGQGVEVTLPTAQRAQGVSPSRERSPREPGDGGGQEGEMEVEVQPGVEAGGEEMAPSRCGLFDFFLLFWCVFILFFCLAVKRLGSPGMTRM